MAELLSAGTEAPFPKRFLARACDGGGFRRKFGAATVAKGLWVAMDVPQHLLKGGPMSAIAAALRPIAIPAWNILRRDPAAQAFTLLRITFTVAPILFGIDKFVNVLTNDWTRYLASEFNDVIPGNAADAMHIVGVVEIVAGLVVLVSPRFGGFLVAAWLGGIIANLLIVGGYGDIALRDFGLLLAALTLARLSSAYPGRDTVGHAASPPLGR
jgi:hypothetical protein